MRLFDEGTSWEQARKDTRYPTARLDARKHHAVLSRPLRALLGQWNTVDQERRDADDAVVDANALVSAIDEELDDTIGLLVARLLYEAGNDPANATFKTYFPEPPNEVIRLGLESEIARTKLLIHVAEEKKASKETWAILKTVAEIEKRGTEALAARVVAYTGVSRVALRIQTWKENANAARRGVEAALETYAVAHGKPRSYADAFFPATARVKKKAAPS
ncbi:MAG: hypothetical protein ABJE95_18155 [Byssovorax sp.]